MCLTEFDEEKFRQMMIEEGRAEGREEGLAEGRTEGIELNKRTNAQNLIGLIPDELIAEKIGLPLEEVQKMHM